MRLDGEPGAARVRRASHLRRAAWILLGVCCVLLFTVTFAVAQSGGDYDLSWWTIDGGGIASTTASGYTLGSAVGQPEAALWSGDGYTLTGGFWQIGAAAEPQHRIYLPIVLRDR